MKTIKYSGEAVKCYSHDYDWCMADDVEKLEQRLERIEKYAEGLAGCTHELCSISEAMDEERYGKEMLKILREKQ